MAENDVSSEQMILLIRQRAKSIILICILAFSVSMFILVNYPSDYKSEVVFYFTNVDNTNSKLTDDENKEATSFASGTDSRVVKLNYSSELIGHLIKKFNLYQHYKIDTAGEYHYEKTYAMLSDNITVNKTAYNAIKITVHDRDSHIAAEIANEIVNKIDELNKKLIIADKKKTITTYETLINDLKKEATLQTDSLKNLIEKYIGMIRDIKENHLNAGAIANMQFLLSQLSYQTQSATNELLKDKKLYGFSLKSIETNNLPTVVITRYPFPETKDNFLQTILISSITTILFFLATILAIYLIETNKLYFRK